MVRIIITSIILTVVTLVNVNGFVYNLEVMTNKENSEIKIKWFGPTNYTESTLFYNVYYSSNKPILKDNKIVNIYDFDILSTLEYKTNNIIFSVTDKLSNNYYLIIPITNGTYIYTYLQNTLPQIDVKNIMKTTEQIELSQANLNYSMETNRTNITVTNIIETSKEYNAIPYEGEDLKKIVINYFLKRKYKIAIEKLKYLKESVEETEKKEYIDIYIARCYYAIGKKRKALYILLNIKSDNLKSLAEFWLNRYSRYFFSNL
ncbi:MAG: hypothetical protein ACK4F9_02985 [Brevinematia bacterium]